MRKLTCKAAHRLRNNGYALNPANYNEYETEELKELVRLYWYHWSELQYVDFQVDALCPELTHRANHPHDPQYSNYQVKND